MPAELLTSGSFDDVEPLWEWRADRLTRSIAAAIAATSLLGIATVHDGRRNVAPTASRDVVVRQEVAARVVTRSVDPAPHAVVITSATGLEVRPVGEPSTAAARRVAQLVAHRVCRNLERPRFRRERGTADGRSASFVIARSSDTPRKSAGFVLDLTWRDGGYVARVSQAYGSCTGG